MNRNTLDRLAQSAIAIDPINLLITLSLSLVLAVGILFVYRRTHRGFHFERSFSLTLLMTPPIVALVMTFIGSNLALSLGMVGALSIIRFRTAIKDSRDMVYIFWCIATGLGCGTTNWSSTVIAFFFIAIVLLALMRFDLDEGERSSYALIIKADSSPTLENSRVIVEKYAQRSRLRSVEVGGGRCEQVIELERMDGINTKGLVSELQALEGVTSVTLLSPQLSHLS